MAEKNTGYNNVVSEKALGFFITEAYKTIRTNLQFAISASEDKVTFITSFEPNAGKSISSANIAITMAQTGARVLLIDADMRNASQHKIFNIQNTDGLSKLLSGLSKADGSVLRKNIRPNLDLLTAGPMPPNPSELLGSKTMKKLLDALRGVYDYIFIDCPPVGVVSDALSLLSYVHNVVLIVRQKQTRQDDIRHTMESIKSLDGKILGVVLTDVETDASPFSGKYGRYGRYGKYGKYGKYGSYSRYGADAASGAQKYIDASVNTTVDKPDNE